MLHVEVSGVSLIDVWAILVDVFDVIKWEAPEITSSTHLDPSGSRRIPQGCVNPTDGLSN